MDTTNRTAKRIRTVLYSFLVLFSLYACNRTPEKPRVLVFSKTAGYYHESIPSGLAAVQQLGIEYNFDVDTTKDARYFTEDSLKNYDAVIFLSTTGDVLDIAQQAAFERYIQAGGGYVGIHSAADTEYEWPWYNKLAGAYFLSHPNNPNVRQATIHVLDSTHQAMKGLPALWERNDEWYNYKSINPEINVLANLDETTYEGGENGENHPIVWYHEYDGGRAFYTGGGHTNESYQEPLFLQHILGGIRYAIGDNNELDFSKASTQLPPEENRFSKAILSTDLNEPMELAVAPDGRVFFIERAGKFYAYEPTTQSTKLLHDFPVKAVDKYLNGLLGMTIDPDFADNNFIYFFYTAAEDGQHKQHISRFTLKEDGFLDLESEQVIIEVPIDLEVSAHTGGSMAWDKDKNLYVSTGDNTVPFESDGYAPIDERPGRHVFDAQRSSANPNDLRGKILRIHPEPDGSYTIPEGNLFPKETPGTRPEIYVMGCRNPYRISVDPVTSILYWGEIGPDSGKDSIQGPRGYDEVNQAKTAGNYGWPYFIADNIPYKDFDFATKTVGSFFDQKAPQNNSVNNTGINQLPPAREAMIWFPYQKSYKFPQLGEGGRCIMGGPVYHYDEDQKSDAKLPAYYDKALFIYDWMRNWVFAVRLDENQNYQTMEPFMPETGDFRRPVDMEISRDGVMYILEYGSIYGIDNEDARLVKVSFNAGNRAPIAKINAPDSLGAAPLSITFSAKESRDLDNDRLTYRWEFGGESASTDENPTYTFEENGLHYAVLTVKDPSGSVAVDSIEIIVGNTRPEVSIKTNQNTTFFFEDTPFDYAIEVTDKEDQQPDPQKIEVVFNFIPEFKNNSVVGHQTINYNLGKSLIEASDCKACHQIDKKAVGPTFMQVAEKYAGDQNSEAYLANKIITGGGGVWGEHAMNAHPQLSREEALEIVKYILSIGNQQSKKQLPPAGEIIFEEHKASDKEGIYLIRATYEDMGKGSVPLSGSDLLLLRPNRIRAENADEFFKATVYSPIVGSMHHNSYFVLKDIDLKDIETITYRYSSPEISASVELHAGSPDGPVIGKMDYTATGSRDNFKEITTPVKDPGKKSDLYFVVKSGKGPKNNLIEFESVTFNQSTPTALH